MHSGSLHGYKVEEVVFTHEIVFPVRGFEYLKISHLFRKKLKLHNVSMKFETTATWSQWEHFKDLTEALLQENKKMNKLFIFLSEPKQPPQSDRYPATGKKRIPLSRGGGGVEARCCECTLWLMLEARHWRSQHAYFLSSVQSSWETLCAVAAGTFWSLAYLKTERKKNTTVSFYEPN